MSVPDPTILARGLGKMMKKLVSMHPELHCRLQLIRSTLMVDAVPTHDSAAKYSEHLLAELEQMGHQSRKRDTVPEVPKLKKFEEPSRDSKEVKERREGEEKRANVASTSRTRVAVVESLAPSHRTRKMNESVAGSVAARIIRSELHQAQRPKRRRKAEDG